MLSTDLEEILKNYFSNSKENIKNIVEETTSEGEETKLISKDNNNIKIDLSEIYNGEIKKVIFAKDVLVPNENGTTPEEKSPYVKYNNILCRAFYNDIEHGLQIITNDNVTNVTLGYNDPTVTADDFTYNGSLTLSDNFKKAAASYNNAVDTLNNKAKEYMGTKAIDARSVGSSPFLGEDGKFKGDTLVMWSEDNQYMIYYGFNDIFKNEDPSYRFDETRIKSLQINTTSTTWLASRNIPPGQTGYLYISVRCIDKSGDVNDSCLFYLYRSNGGTHGYSVSNGFRPIFLLPSDIIITSGSGSLEDPYIID